MKFSENSIEICQ